VPPCAVGVFWALSQSRSERSWWQILWLLAKGHSTRTIAENTGYTHAWIGQIAKR